MKISTFAKLHSVLPNGTISDAILGSSYISDAKGNVIGHIDTKTTEIYISEKYNHKEAIVQRLQKAGFVTHLKQYELF